jgi:hypothetical protein
MLLLPRLVIRFIRVIKASMAIRFIKVIKASMASMANRFN